MIKAVILDVDGTLLDSMHIWKDAGEIFLRKRSIEARPGLSDIMWSMSIPEGAAYLKQEYRLQETVDEIVSGVVSVVRDFYCQEVSLKSGVLRFLQKLKANELPVVIATSSDKSYLEAAFKRTGIADFFQRIFTCEEAGAGKTESKIYLQAANYLGFRPEEIAVFEDAFYAAKTAKAADFRVVGVYDPFCEVAQEEMASLCDVYLKDFSDDSLFWRYLCETEVNL